MVVSVWGPDGELISAGGRSGASREERSLAELVFETGTRQSPEPWIAGVFASPERVVVVAEKRELRPPAKAPPPLDLAGDLPG